MGGLDEEKIYEEPKKRKVKTSSNESKESEEFEKEDLPPAKRRSFEAKAEENKFDIVKRKRRVRFQLDKDDEMDESFNFNSRKPVKVKAEKVDPHENFIALHYEFDWNKVP